MNRTPTILNYYSTFYMPVLYMANYFFQQTSPRITIIAPNTIAVYDLGPKTISSFPIILSYKTVNPIPRSPTTKRIFPIGFSPSLLCGIVKSFQPKIFKILLTVRDNHMYFVGVGFIRPADVAGSMNRTPTVLMIAKLLREIFHVRIV